MRGDDIAALIVSALFILLLAGLWLLVVILGVRFAKRKGYSPHWMWFGLHPMGALVTFIVMACLPQQARCPACSHFVSPKYDICPYCRASLVRTTSTPLGQLGCKTELSNEDRPRIVHHAEKDGALVGDTLWFFADYLASTTKCEGPYFVPQYGDPDSPGPTYITEFKLWRALDTGNFATHLSKLYHSTESYFYKEKNILDVNAMFNTCYVLQVEANDLSSHTRVDTSEKALLFTTAGAVLAHLRQHLDDKLLQKVLSEAAGKDPAFAGVEDVQDHKAK